MRFLALASMIAVSTAAGAGELSSPRTDADIAPVRPREAAPGQLLFYDPTLSGNREVACATCQHPTFGASDGLSLSLKEPVSAILSGQRQSVTIARAVYFNAKILIMDEPTAALGVHETAMVADLIKELKDQGLGIFLISHGTREMMELCDRVSVMKNVQLVGAERVEDVTEDDILSIFILGKNPKREAA